LQRPRHNRRAGGGNHRLFPHGERPGHGPGRRPSSWRNLGSDGRYADSRTEPQWTAVYRSLDAISPWSVGRFRDDNGADSFARLRLIPDITETRRLGIEYIAVVFPGYSRRHGAVPEKNLTLNFTPRRYGALYDRQVKNAVKAGPQALYTGFQTSSGFMVLNATP
jgi:hypothetical protein